MEETVVDPSPLSCDLARAFVAQGLEHWSRKPGVESSILSEGKVAPILSIAPHPPPPLPPPNSICPHLTTL